MSDPQLPPDEPVAPSMVPPSPSAPLPPPPPPSSPAPTYPAVDPTQPVPPSASPYGQQPPGAVPYGQPGMIPYVPGQPMQTPALPLSSAARTVGWVAFAFGVLVVIAAFLPWIRMEGLFNATISGIGDSEFGTKDGVITLPLGALAGAFGMVRGLSKKQGGLQLAVGIVVLCAGALVALIGLVDYADVADAANQSPGFVDASVGEGLILTLLGGVALTILGIVGIVRRA